jgi:hypothetical protein
LRTDTAPPAATATAPSGIERRGAPRFAILQRCLVRPPHAAGPEDWHCIVYNISATGLGLTLPLPLQPGTLLEIQAWDLAAAPPLLARVVRTNPVQFLWFCGCELLKPLSEAELRAWQQGPTDWLQ